MSHQQRLSALVAAVKSVRLGNRIQKRNPQRPMMLEQLEQRQMLATTLYWDTSSTGGLQGGSGTWSTSAANWNTNEGGSGSRVPWSSGAIAVFPPNTSAATVTVSGSLSVAEVQVWRETGIDPNTGNTATGNYTVVGGSLTGTGSLFQFRVGLNSTMRVDTPVTGAMGVSKHWGGVLQLYCSSNSYTGGTTVYQGILGFVQGGLHNTTGSISLNGPCRLSWGGTNTQDVSSRINITGSDVELNVNNNNVTFGTALAGNGNVSVVKRGAGTLTLNRVNAFPAGSFSIMEGTLAVGNSSALALSAVGMRAGDSGCLLVGTNSVSVPSLSGLGTLSIDGAGSLIVGTNGANSEYSGLMNGTAGLTKVGAGTLTMSGQGGVRAVAINEGTLKIDGSFGYTTSATTVASGAKLTGRGEVLGSVQVQDGGQLEPTDGIGVLQLDGLTLSQGAVMSLQVNGFAPSEFGQWGIHLTQPSTTHSVCGHGGLPAHVAGVGAEVCHRRGVSGVPVRPSLAAWLHLSSLPGSGQALANK